MFVYSEKATKFCKISTLILSIVHTDKSKVEILQNFVAFLEYINFNILQIFPNYLTFCVLHLILFGCHMTKVKWFRQFFDMFGTFFQNRLMAEQNHHFLLTDRQLPSSCKHDHVSFSSTHNDFLTKYKGEICCLFTLIFRLCEKVDFSTVAGSTVCDSMGHETCVVFQSSE